MTSKGWLNLNMTGVAGVCPHFICWCNIASARVYDDRLRNQMMAARRIITLAARWKGQWQVPLFAELRTWPLQGANFSAVRKPRVSSVLGRSETT